MDVRIADVYFRSQNCNSIENFQSPKTWKRLKNGTNIAKISLNGVVPNMSFLHEILVWMFLSHLVEKYNSGLCMTFNDIKEF